MSPFLAKVCFSTWSEDSTAWRRQTWVNNYHSWTTGLNQWQTLRRRLHTEHTHRPAKFNHRGSSCQEHTSTWTPLSTQQSLTVPIQAKNLSFPTSL